MKIKLLFSFVFLFSLVTINFCCGQAGEWVWVHGTSNPYNSGNLGTLGIPSPANEPPALYEACEWTDLNGNFWLYGGTDGSQNVHNDLLRFDPATNMWTWMFGTNTPNDPGNYGTQGVASPSNLPPARGYGYASWVDLSGNLWMFGGDKSSGGALSDLWKYDIAANEWTWMKGPNITNQVGVYGIQGVPDPANNPGARYECGASWTDNAGDFWLFGGLNYGTYNDLWRFNIATNTWTWMKGSQLANQTGTYGTQGTEAPANTPGAREAHCRWKDNNGNLWLFGGQFTDFTSYVNYNDLWRFNPVTNNWAWMNGSSTGNGIGFYGTKCNASSANEPSPRLETRAAWTDASGNLWMFGGGIDFFESQVTNDLWKYCVHSNQWAWISGDSIANPAGSWGTINVSSPLNKPNGRGGSNGWMDNNGHLYLFGGTGAISPGIVPYNDLWKYTIDSTCASECSSTGMNEINSNPDFNMYPNPVSNEIVIDLFAKQNIIDVKIFDSRGRAVQNIKTEMQNQNIIIDISHFDPGIYFIQLIDEKGTAINGKFLKE